MITSSSQRAGGGGGGGGEKGVLWEVNLIGTGRYEMIEKDKRGYERMHPGKLQTHQFSRC
jgi:hypothetical protein